VTTRSLDLGCGRYPENPLNCEEVWGVDIRDGLGARVRVADLVIQPIPFEDQSFDTVTAFDFLEHVPRVVYAPQRRFAFVELMNEICRVLKPGGAFVAHTPAFPSPAAFKDPTHVNFITEETLPQYFCGDSPLARMYGFTGAFAMVEQKWVGDHALLSFLRKCPAQIAQIVSDTN
jgi:SAM-dependent methyltransferase